MSEKKSVSEEEAIQAMKLLLVEEMRKHYQLRNVFEQEFKKPFDQEEVEKELSESCVDEVDSV